MRTRERRDLLTSVRAAILRVALRADEVLAIKSSLGLDRRRRRIAPRQTGVINEIGGNPAAKAGRSIVRAPSGVNWIPHALRASGRPGSNRSNARPGRSA